MTEKVTLPEDGSFIKVTNGTNNAWVSGDCYYYIGSGTPNSESAVHPSPADGNIFIYSPVIVWVRHRSAMAPQIVVSTW